MDFLAVLLVVISSIWVAVDASKYAERTGTKGPGGTGPAPWFFASLLLWLIVFPYYLYKRGQTGEARRCPHCAEIIQREAKVCRHCGRDLVEA